MINENKIKVLTAFNKLTNNKSHWINCYNLGMKFNIKNCTLAIKNGEQLDWFCNKCKLCVHFIRRNNEKTIID